MTKTTVNIHDAKTHLSRLLDRAAAGETIIIAKAGTPKAVLGPIPAATPRRPGRFAGQIHMADDFDAPLAGKDLVAWEGGSQ